MKLSLQHRQTYFRTALLLPGVVFCLLLFGVFFFNAVKMSMHDFRFGAMGPWVGLGNYVSVLTSPVFLKALVNNFAYTGGVVAMSFLVGLGMALLATTRIVSNRLYIRAVICLPMLCIPAASGLLWRLLYSTEFGLLSQFCSLIGVHYVSLLASPSTSLVAVMIADIWAWTPYMFLILVAGLESVPREPYEAADIDGASSTQKFFHITLPLCRYVMLIALSLKTLDTYRNFAYIWVMTQGGPGRSSEVLSSLIYKSAFQNFNFGEGTAMGVLTFVAAIPLIAAYVAVMIGSAKQRQI